MNVFFSLTKQFFLPKRLLSALTAFFFLVTSIFPNVSIAQTFPQTILNLPIPGSVVATTAGFTPAIIKGVNLYPDNPLKFDFIIDKGDAALTDEAFKQESTRLIKYFLSSLTVPKDEMWVNLSPYEKNRIVPQDFGKTEMGRDLLAQDYMLKQLTASLMNPDDKLGGEFWQRVYTKAQVKYGTTDIPMNTFNKIWIVPEKAVVYEHEKGAFIVKSHLKVLLEEDYVALSQYKNSATSQSEANGISSEKHYALGVRKEDLKVVSGVQSAIIKDLLIPEIEKEVNEGQTFANLRQIYNAVILASWYKQALKESLLGQVYVDKKMTKGVESEDKSVNEKIYNQYVESFKKGVYNFIKEDYEPTTQEVVNRKYFSGGAAFMRTMDTTQIEKDAATLVEPGKDLNNVTVDFASVSSENPRQSNVDADRRNFLRRAGKLGIGALGVLAGFRSSGPAKAADAFRPSKSKHAIDQFRTYIDMLQNGQITFNLGLSGKKAAAQLNFNDGFAYWYDVLTEKVNQKMTQSGGIDIDEIIQIAKNLILENSTNLASFNFNKLKPKLSSAQTSEEIDRLIGEAEVLIRNDLQAGVLNAQKAEKLLNEINDILVPRYYVNQSPLGLSDQRAIVVYKIIKDKVKETDQGNVTGYFVDQITQYRDGLLRGNPGWSSYFNKYVIVFSEAVRKTLEPKIQLMLEGNKPFKASSRLNPSSQEAQMIERMANLTISFTRKGLSTIKDKNQRVSIVEEGIFDHEVEHKRRTKMFNLKEGDIIHEGNEEEIAILRSMQGDEPFHIVSHVIELAANDLNFAWSILGRSTGQQNKQKIIENLETNILNMETGAFKTIVNRAYQDATKDLAMLGINSSEDFQKGDIDLNPTLLNTEIKRNDRGVIIPAFKGQIMGEIQEIVSQEKVFKDLGLDDDLNIVGIPPDHIEENPSLLERYEAIRNQDGVLRAYIVLGAIVVIYNSDIKRPLSMPETNVNAILEAGTYDDIKDTIFINIGGSWDFLNDKYRPSWNGFLLKHEFRHRLFEKINQKRGREDSQQLAYLDELHSQFFDAIDDNLQMIHVEDPKKKNNVFKRIDTNEMYSTKATGGHLSLVEQNQDVQAATKELFYYLQSLILLNDFATENSQYQSLIKDVAYQSGSILAISSNVTEALTAIQELWKEKIVTNKDLTNAFTKVVAASSLIDQDNFILSNFRDVGGIDLNPTLLNTEIKHNGHGVIIPAFKGAVPDLKGMEGFVPNIINVTPVTNLQFLLGLDTKSDEHPQHPDNENEKPVDVSFNLSALPVKEREEAILMY